MPRRFFADTCFLTGLMDNRDPYNRISSDILQYLMRKRLIASAQEFYISNYIIVEVIHNLLRNHANFEDIKKNYETLKTYNVFQVDSNHIDDAFNKKLKSFINHRTHEPKMGIVDATSLVVMDEEQITYIISFDGDFDNLPFVTPIKNKEMIDTFILNRYR